jgi:hypothetical protein
VRSRSFASFVSDVIDSDSDSTGGGYATKTPKNRVQCMCALCDEADATNGAPAPGPGDVTHNCYTKEVWSAEKQDWCCANKQLGCPPNETPKDEASKDKTPPKDETPETDTPKDETPETDTPTDETPEIDTPETDTPTDETPETDTPKDERPEHETPENDIPETDTPETDTPKGDAAGNNSKAGSCSCMGYNADGSTVPSGECGWASQQQTPGNSCMQVASEAECVVVPAEVGAGIAPAAQFKLGGKCD